MRSGKDNKMFYNKERCSFLVFDDARISIYDMNNLEEDCYGESEGKKDGNNNGNGIWPSIKNLFTESNDKDQSISKCAYILVYERVNKSGIKILLDGTEKSNLISNNFENVNIIKINNSNKFYNEKKYDIFRKDKIDDTPGDETDTSALKDVFYDEISDEYFYYKNHYDYEFNFQEKYYNEVLGDNVANSNDERIYTKHFTSFINNLIKNLIKLKESGKQVDLIINKNYDFLLKCVLDYIASFDRGNIQSLISGISDLNNSIPSLSNTFLQNLLENKYTILNCFFQSDINNLYKKLIINSVLHCFRQLEIRQIEILDEFNNSNNKPLVIEFMDYILSLFPTEVSVNWTRMCVFLEVSFVYKLDY
jgi:hypothetical protein